MFYTLKDVHIMLYKNMVMVMDYLNKNVPMSSFFFFAKRYRQNVCKKMINYSFKNTEKKNEKTKNKNKRKKQKQNE